MIKQILNLLKEKVEYSNIQKIKKVEQAEILKAKKIELENKLDTLNKKKNILLGELECAKLRKDKLENYIKVLPPIGVIAGIAVASLPTAISTFLPDLAWYIVGSIKTGIGIVGIIIIATLGILILSSIFSNEIQKKHVLLAKTNNEIIDIQRQIERLK